MSWSGVFKKVSRGMPLNFQDLCWGMPSLPVSVWKNALSCAFAVDVDFKKPQYANCRFLDAATTDINALATLTGALGSWFLGLVFGVLVRALGVAL